MGFRLTLTAACFRALLLFYIELLARVEKSRLLLRFLATLSPRVRSSTHEDQLSCKTDKDGHLSEDSVSRERAFESLLFTAYHENDHVCYHPCASDCALENHLACCRPQPPSVFVSSGR